MASRRIEEMLRRKRDYYESRGSDYLNSDSPVSREEPNLPTHTHDDRYFTKAQQNATQEIIDNKQIEQDGRLDTLEGDVDTLQTDVMNKADLEHIHPDATTTQAGFMSASDKAKLNQAITSAPVSSVNGKTGAVVLSASDVSAASSSHTHAVATVNSAGFMSAADKQKVDSSITSAPVTSVNSKTGAVSLTASDVGAASASHIHANATESSNGFMTNADKQKLNALPETPVELVNGKAGASIVLTASDVGAATSGHTHAAATPSSAGFMSAADKNKLDQLGKTIVYAYATAQQSIPASTTTKINFGAELYDTNAEFAHTTGTFTAKTAGFYQVSSYYENNWFTGMSSGTFARLFMNLYKNGAESITMGATVIPYNHSGGVSGTAIVELDVGDTLDIRVWCTHAFTNRARGANYDYVNIVKLF
jgi:hypothetical protein